MRTSAISTNLVTAAAMLLMASAASHASAASGTDPARDQDALRRRILGEWVSIAPEVRPSAQKSADGSPKPFYLTRDFDALPGDRFELTIVNFADPYGRTPLARISLRGRMTWLDAHPIAEGARKVDFTADEGYDVTPLAQGFADVLNKVAASGFHHWEVGATQSVLRRAFPPFGLAADRDFMEHDLVYMTHDMLFWGARNVDGRGFDSESNRPTNLQIPLVRRR